MKNDKNLKFKSYKIIKKEQATSDTVIYDISGHLQFSPGQFVQAMLPHFGEATFAPCSDPNNHKIFQLSIRNQGSTSNAFTKMQVGENILIRGPYGNGWPVGKLIGKNVIIIAGGMGIVPIRPLIFELLKYRSEFKKISFLAGFKTPHHLLFENDLVSWRDKLDYLQVSVEKEFNDWWGEGCIITDLIKKIKINPQKSVVLICGPEIMYTYCIDILSGPKKVENKNIYLSMERRMECGVGLCQHCNIGKYYVCKDGPVFRYDLIKDEIGK